MAERNIGCTLCNFSRSQAAYSYELGDVSRLGLSLVQALAALGSTDTGVTCIFVYFLSKCWGHSVLRRTVCLHKHSCQPLRPRPRLSWKAQHPRGRPLLLECRLRLQAPSSHCLGSRLEPPL